MALTKFSRGKPRIFKWIDQEKLNWSHMDLKAPEIQASQAYEIKPAVRDKSGRVEVKLYINFLLFLFFPKRTVHCSPLQNIRTRTRLVSIYTRCVFLQTKKKKTRCFLYLRFLNLFPYSGSFYKHKKSHKIDFPCRTRKT